MFLKSTESPRRKPRNIKKKEKEKEKKQVYLWLTNPTLHLQNRPACKRRTEVGRRSSLSTIRCGATNSALLNKKFKSDSSNTPPP